MTAQGCACTSSGQCPTHAAYAMCRAKGPAVDEQFGINYDAAVGDRNRTRNTEHVWCTLRKGHLGPHVGNGFVMKRVTFS